MLSGLEAPVDIAPNKVTLLKLCDEVSNPGREAWGYEGAIVHVMKHLDDLASGATFAGIQIDAIMVSPAIMCDGNPPGVPPHVGLHTRVVRGAALVVKSTIVEQLLPDSPLVDDLVGGQQGAHSQQRHAAIHLPIV